MCPLCISTATWFVGTTLLPAALAAILVKIPSPTEITSERCFHSFDGSSQQ
jgi:hypothetical protein